ncbi:IS66 family transposase, partial [Sphingomonas sp. Sph1(2015)]|uniref:IS66 family transposase n=1 Tax=Sphingomonas sp. Sph1(2015) TaxID=1628084 RepID=UPI001115A35F
MLPRTSSIWRRDSHPTASGKPGAVQNAVNDHAEAELARLHDIIAALRRHRFGARSEKLDDEQLEMAF